MAHPQCLVRCDPRVYEILFDEIKRDDLLNKVFYHINPEGKLVIIILLKKCQLRPG